MTTKSFFKRTKSIPIGFLLLILVFGIMHIYRTIGYVGDKCTLEVETYNLKEKTYKEVAIGENKFTTGSEGKLRWRVKDVKEAFLVSLVDRNTWFYDLFYFLLIDIALFIMMYRINEDAVFSDQLFKGVTVLLYVIMFYPFFGVIANQINERIIQELTDNQFTSQYQRFSATKFQLLIFLMIIMLPMVQKVINLQKEQDLTI